MKSLRLTILIVFTALSGVEAKPNFILCMMDDQGWGDIGYRDDSIVETPNLDEMAAGGIRFDRFYAQSVCSPARGSFLTGRDPNRYLCLNPGYDLPLAEKTIAEYLQKAGYATGLFGKWHLGGIDHSNGKTGAGFPERFDDKERHPGNQGFDEWIAGGNFFDMNPRYIYDRTRPLGPIEGESSQLTMDWAIDFIDRHAKQRDPFLCVVWFPSPHAPWVTSEEDSRPYQSEGEWSGHYGEIVALDREMGRLRNHLRKLKIAEDTFLLFCSDNGGPDPRQNGGLRGAKGNLLEGGIRVPAMVEWQGRITPRITDAVASTNDILPTVLEIAGIDPDPETALDGESLVPILEQRSDTRVRPLAVRRSKTPTGEVLCETVIDRDWKLMRGTIEYRRGEPEVLSSANLFNLDRDAREEVDLAAQHPETVARLSEHLDRWQESIDSDIAALPTGENASRSGANRYHVYTPEITHRPIYRAAVPKAFDDGPRHSGKPAPGDPLPYNHAPSLAHFDGRFFCIWQGSQWDLRENQGNQKLWLTTSPDFETWSEPEPFVAMGPTAVDGGGVQKQPGMLRYSDEELWVVWHHHRGEDQGLYFSRLRKGEAHWENRRLWKEFVLNGNRYMAYPTQDPWKFSNGRVVVPCVFIDRDEGKAIRFAGAVYTDDGGETWNRSNFFRNPESATETWEPFIFEEANGDVRAYARSPFFETVTGSGARPGEPLRFDGFTQRSWMEGVSERPWVGRIPGQRYVMLKHDIYAAGGIGSVRQNLALSFSHTGRDDFVFGPPVSAYKPSRWKYWSASYAQGCIVDGTLYVAYSDTTPRGPQNTPRSIIGAKIATLPLADERYLYPRSRQFSNPRRYRDGKGTLQDYSEELWHEMPRAVLPVEQDDGEGLELVFGDGSAAGVEVRPEDLADGRLVIEMEVRLDRIQEHGLSTFPEIREGKVTLLTLGDHNPLRVAYQPNAGDRLWIFDGNQWERIDGFMRSDWNRVRLRVDRRGTLVEVGGDRSRLIQHATLPRNPVLYLGEGVLEKKFDGQPPVFPLNNRGSEWRIDLEKFRVH